MELTESKEPESLTNEILQYLQSKIPDLAARIEIADGQKIIVCDYIPVKIPYDETEMGKAENIYREYLAALYSLREKEMPVMQISKHGLVDVRDCFRVLKSGECVYVIPTAEYGKVKHDGIHPKTEKMEASIQTWFHHHDKIKNENLEEAAAASLVGVSPDYLAPVLSGLKPVGMDMRVNRLSYAVADSLPQNLQIIRVDNEEVIFNPKAVKEIVEKNLDDFERLGLNANSSAQKVVRTVLRAWSQAHGGSDDEYHIPLGLLFGYDRHSIENYRRFRRSGRNEEPGETPYVLAELHNIHEIPFNIWSVDYAVIDEETNDNYKSLKEKYHELQKFIEGRLGVGQSPLQTLLSVPNWEDMDSAPATVKVRTWVRDNILAHVDGIKGALSGIAKHVKGGRHHHH